MSGSVTPARRPRDDSDDDEEDFDVSVDGESPARSNPSKRARLDESGSDDADSEESEDPEAPVLPDSFRRSPKGKGPATNVQPGGHSTSRTPRAHLPGSIVRVTLTNFVTYTKAEFKPGPNLNMVIGPNGTGKSTLVCALCIGLGWPTKHLGRGKDLEEFVKHSAKRGEIEIELAADPERHEQNPVITTRIKQGDKQNAEYLINGKKENGKRVRELARSFSIQVDNLCQFLPQDRVVEFAGLSPVDLLTQTQRAAAPQEMSEWHDQLKEWRKMQKTQQVDQQRLTEDIKALQKRQDSQQADVNRVKERDSLSKRKAALVKLKPFADYKTAKAEYASAKDRRKQAEKELTQLTRRMEPNMAAVNEKSEYVKQLDKAFTFRKNVAGKFEVRVNTLKGNLATAATRLQECSDQVDAERNSMRDVKQKIPGLQQELRKIDQALANPPAQVNIAELTENVRQKTRDIRDIGDKIKDLNDEVGSLGTQIGQRMRIIENAEREKNDLQSQAGQQASKLRTFSQDTAAAWQWIQHNRDRLDGEVFGPPLVECSLRDQRHAAAVESMLQRADLLAITVTSAKDFRMLNDQLYGSMKLHDLNIRSSLHPVEFFRAPMATESLQQFGLERWLLELIDGPGPVLAMLCDNRSIHQTAFTSRELSESHFNALQQSSITSWVTPKQSHTISRRREYGDRATSTNVRDLRQARFFTDAPIDQQRERDIDRRVAETQSEIDELKQSKRSKQEACEELKTESKRLAGEKSTLEKEKADIQTRKAKFEALPTTREGFERKYNDAKEKLAGSAERRRQITQKGDAISLEKGQHALDYANAVEQLRVLHIQLFEVEILQIEAKSDHQQLEALHEEERRLLKERKDEVERLDKHEQELLAVGRHLRDHCRQIGEDLDEFEQELCVEVQLWTSDHATTEIVSVEAQLESLVGGGNERTLLDFEKRVKDIEEKTARFHALTGRLNGLELQITDIKDKWEPQLDELVANISEAFSENFSKIQCAGEVGVYKDENFEDWAIQIKVKFRENEPLSLLDSHRQSGGERAVSTIFYLMALQSLARAPFRVVDEINQGMDPRNERMVHSRMVDIACAGAGEGRQGSQYFLITPKLLQGLRYHRDMKVHCIASGEYMPGDYKEVDFARAAKRALELRGGSGSSRVGMAMG